MHGLWEIAGGHYRAKQVGQPAFSHGFFSSLTVRNLR
jgi:hypothetical protein